MVYAPDLLDILGKVKGEQGDHPFHVLQTLHERLFEAL